VQKIAVATDKTVEEVNRMYETEKIDPRVTGLIHEIHQNYKTALLTNAHHEFIDDILQDNNLSQIFDEVVVSSRIGIVKPDPRIFAYVLNKLGIEANDAVYIDDLERHVSAASDLGMEALLFQNFEQCKQDLDRVLSKQ
jgi:epoxide hydrolase-like predicted phosphatase